ncbi:hypothetical protein QUA81_11395 [Microcoleus sp. F6_B4]
MGHWEFDLCKTGSDRTSNLEKIYTLGIGHWAWGIGHGASGMGHRAWGIGHF